MFLQGESSAGGRDGYKGPGIKLSLNDLAQKMSYRFRDRVTTPLKRKMLLNNEIAGPAEPAKKGKKKDYYGVDNGRFAGEQVSAGIPGTIAAISKTSAMEEEDQREAVYEKNRPAIQYKLRNSSKDIDQICFGFFKSPLHLSKQFSYVTRCDDLTGQIRSSLVVQLGHLEKVLLHIDQSMELRDKLSDVQTECEVDYQGATVFKDIMILRLAGDMLDSDGSALVRFKKEGPPAHSSPFIMAVPVARMFVFDVWCERKKLLGDLDMAEAIASFLHLSFVCNLKYPKEAQTTADILQRQFARYGDYTGTRTQAAKTTAKSKFDLYLSRLGMILSLSE